MKVMMKKISIKAMVTGAPNDTQHQNKAHPQNSTIDSDGVLLTNAQCNTVQLIDKFMFEVP